MSAEIDYMQAKGWLTDGERKLLFDLAAQLPSDAVILNIGVEFGASLACLRAGNPTAQIYGVDLDCSKAVSSYDCGLIQRDSHKLVNQWIWPTDLVFVDGDHGQAGVLMDAGFANFLPVGGHILFQDCWDWADFSIVHQVVPGVNAAVVEWFARPDIIQEFEELPSVGTTRVFRRVRARAEVQEHEQSGITTSSGFDTDLRTAGNTGENGQTASGKSEIQRNSKNFNRGR